MSETEHHRGKAIKVDIPEGKTAEEVALEILQSKKIKMAEYYHTAMECLSDECYWEYFYHRKTETLYAIKDRVLDPDDEIIDATENADGTIDYHLMYYNGGAGFDECLEEAINKLKS